MNHQQNKLLVQRIESLVSQYFLPNNTGQAKSEFGDRLGILLENASAEFSEPQIKQVTILLSDLRGFTAIAEGQPATVVLKMLNRYFEAMSGIISKYNGTIDKFMGDAILALFGVPYGSDHDTASAIACAVEMQKAMLDVNKANLNDGLPELHMGIGINSGEVAAGSLGSDIHREYTVIGDEVNLVSRIEAYSMRGQILISDPVYRSAADYVDICSSKEVFVKGIRQPVKLYEVAGTQRPVPMQVPESDSRRSPRIKVCLPLVFQQLENQEPVARHHHGEVLDLSYGGMLASLPFALAPYSSIRMRVALSLFQGEQTDLDARVLHTRPAGDHFESSFEFVGIMSETQASIKQYVDRTISG